MKSQLMLGLSLALALGLAACSAVTGNDDVGGGNEDAAVPVAEDTAPPAVDTAAPDPYVWVVIQDTEQDPCTTNGPGSDIDAVALMSGGAPIGYGLIGTASYLPNPHGNACDNVDCNGSNCKYAAISATIPAATLVAYTEGPPDALVNAVGDDSGYFSLNAGTLQLEIGDLTGGGAPQAITSGDTIVVYEVDQTYITSGRAPSTCVCLPEHYTVTLETASGVLLPLQPGSLSPDNDTCDPLTTASTEGCGTTTFVVP